MAVCLPPLICLADFGGDWPRYEDALYEIFCRDFKRDLIYFQGQPLGLKRYPIPGGKEATFWHLTSEGAIEARRTPDLRRCERIAWPRSVIEQAADPDLKVWENERRGERRVCLWLEAESYLVVLARRDGYVLPWTAYLVLHEHRKKKLQREFEEFRRSRERG